MQRPRFRRGLHTAPWLWVRFSAVTEEHWQVLALTVSQYRSHNAPVLFSPSSEAQCAVWAKPHIETKYNWNETTDQCYSHCHSQMNQKHRDIPSHLVCTWGRLIWSADCKRNWVWICFITALILLLRYKYTWEVCADRSLSLWRCATTHEAVLLFQHQGAAFVDWLWNATCWGVSICWSIYPVINSYRSFFFFMF